VLRLIDVMGGEWLGVGRTNKEREEKTGERKRVGQSREFSLFQIEF
jgi:hypothetical protein